jgi:hypothetical protein
MRRGSIRKFASVSSASSRAARLLKTVANELQRLGVRWTAPDDDQTVYSEWADWMTLSPADHQYEAVTLSAPRGIRGCLLVHRAVLQG